MSLETHAGHVERGSDFLRGHKGPGEGVPRWTFLNCSDSQISSRASLFAICFGGPFFFLHALEPAELGFGFGFRC